MNRIRIFRPGCCGLQTTLMMVSVGLYIVFAAAVSAQELIPAAYTPAPYNLNVVTVSAGYNEGDLAFDPSAPIDEGSGKIGISTLGYARTLNLAGRYANIGVIMPYVLGDLKGLYLGEPATAERSGVGDMGLRAAINLYGGPAMSPQEFSTYRPQTLIGTTLSISGPTGQYDPQKLINIGTNRWSFKQEVGFVQVMGRWAVDAYAGVTFFTDNTEFLGDNTKAQDPILSTQAHLRYFIKPGLWTALDANFWRGGQTTVDGVARDDEQSNSRVGATVSIRLSPRHNLRIAASMGAITRIGGDFNSIGVSYTYSWLAKRPSK
jgi:hypothetical protein